MSTTLAPPGHANSDAQPIHIKGRWLSAARIGWGALTAFYSTLFLAGLGPSFDRMRLACDPGTCASGHWFALTTAQARSLENLGLSIDLYALYMSALETGLAMLYVGLGLLIFLWRSTERVAFLASLTLVVTGAFLVPAAPAAAAEVYPWLSLIITATFIGGNWLFPVLLFLLPDGRFVPGWSRWFAFLWGATVTAIMLVPEVWPGLAAGQEIINRLSSLVFLIAAIVGVYSQVYRYRRAATRLGRQQIKWIGVGVAGFVVGGFVGAVINPFPANEGTTPLSLRLLAYSLTMIGFAFFAVALACAVLRHRLWDVDVVIKRTLVYGGLTAAIMALYAVTVGALNALFHAQGNAVIAFIGAGLVAVLFQPLRERLQRAVNRLMFGQRDDPYAVLEQFGRQLEATPALETLTPTIVATIKETLKLSYVAVEYFAQDQEALDVSTDTAHTFPMLYQGEPVGRLIVAPREGETNLSRTDKRLLEDLARQGGIALHAARVTAELQRAREQLVTTREEERRRLRRDLHDGLGPTLAAIAAQSEAARDLIPIQPALSAALLDDVVAQAQAATSDIRYLIYNLRPPALDDLGLVAAIQAQAQKVTHPDGLNVVVVAPAPSLLPPLTAAVEAAAFRIVQEALTNVVRHANAQKCTITLEVQQGDLTLEIRDDGCGMRETVQPGVGLRSMRERASELGGEFAIVSTGIGTTVHARISIERMAPTGMRGKSKRENLQANRRIRNG